MRYLKYLGLLAVLSLPAVYSNAQVAIGVQIGPDYGLYNAPPVCAYGFYPDYPFACAPYGYWGPEYFVGGVFIGAGPWDHFYYRHPDFYRRYYRGGFEHFRGGHEFRGNDRGFSEGDRGFRRGDRGFQEQGRGTVGGGGHDFRSGGGGGSRGGGREEFHGGGHGSGGHDGGGHGGGGHGGRR
jgi:hypothetical protein